MSYLAVFVGGGLGSLARYSLGVGAVALGRAALWGTLAANVAACALLAYLVFAPERAGDPPAARLALATGFCGGFSTFSTFGLEVFSLLQAGRHAEALAYLGASALLGLGAVLLVYRLAAG